MPAPIPATLPRPSEPPNRSPSKPTILASPSRARLTAKMIAGRASIAARIYRSFCTNGNGFLRGVRIEISSTEMSASPRCLARMEAGSSIFGAFPPFRPTWREIYRRKTTIARMLRREKNKQRRKPRESLARRHIRCTAQNRAQWIESFRAKPKAKKKGDPRAALPVPDAGMSAGFRLSHHVHSASSARLTR